MLLSCYQLHPLILRSASSRVSKDEATIQASWFETRYALLTMRVLVTQPS